MRDITNNSNTPLKIEELKLSLLTALTPEERFDRMNKLCALETLTILEDLREKHPQLSEDELKIMLARNLWGDKFAEHISLRIRQGY